MNRRGFLFSLSATVIAAAAAITLGRKALPAPEPESLKFNRIDEHGCEVYWLVQKPLHEDEPAYEAGIRWWTLDGMHQLRDGDHFRLVDPHTGVVQVDKFTDLNDYCKTTLLAEGRVKAEYTLYRVIGSPFTTTTSTGGKTWGVQSMPVA